MGRIEVVEYISVSELATKLNKTFVDIIGKFMELGTMVSINQKLSEDMIISVTNAFEFDVSVIKSKISPEERNKESMNGIATGDFVYYKRD